MTLNPRSNSRLELAVGRIKQLLAIANAVEAQVSNRVHTLVAGNQLTIDSISDHCVHRAPGAANRYVLWTEIVIGQALPQASPQFEQLRRQRDFRLFWADRRSAGAR